MCVGGRGRGREGENATQKDNNNKKPTKQKPTNTHHDVARVVDARDPQAQHVGAERRLALRVLAALDDQARVDDVAQGLGHLGAALVEHKAVRQHALVRRAAGGGDGRQQRRLEPAAVLVAALQVQVGRVA